MATELWEQQPGETARAFAAFTTYRDLPPKTRSLVRAVEVHYGVQEGAESRPKLGQLKKWSSRWQWVDRVREYETHLDRTKTATAAEEVAAMARRHWELGRALVARAREAVDVLDPTTLTATQAVALADAGVKIERLARGGPVGDEDAPGVACPQDTIRDFLTDHPELAGEFCALAEAAGWAEQANASDVAPMRRRGPRRRSSNE
jgi:hypothetical protein